MAPARQGTRPPVDADGRDSGRQRESRGQLSWQAHGPVGTRAREQENPGNWPFQSRSGWWMATQMELLLRPRGRGCGEPPGVGGPAFDLVEAAAGTPRLLPRRGSAGQ